MKKNVFCAVGIIATTLCSSVYAAEGVVQDFTKNVTSSIPYTEQVCETSQVPIYQGGEMNTERAIIGGIIGGVIGNQFGKGSGKNAATGVGAMIGAIQGGQTERRISGYQSVNQCFNRTTYQTQTSEVYSYSVVEFYHEGRFYRVKFDKYSN
tara:strand:- start:229 stop:684 length:456 start_codon:yes stop_codon:yes gene_type:complete